MATVVPSGSTPACAAQAVILSAACLRDQLGVPPRGPGPHVVPAGELEGDLRVVQPQGAHSLAKGALLGALAGLRVRHGSPRV
jgi:hypothetical protein